MKVREEMTNSQVFAKYAFHIQSGRLDINHLIQTGQIQTVYPKPPKMN